MFYWSIDIFLTELSKAGTVDKDKLFNKLSVDERFYDILSYLIDEGFVSVDEFYVSITSVGNLFLGKGGFKGKAIRRVIRAMTAIVGFIASVAAILAFVFTVF